MVRAAKDRYLVKLSQTGNPLAACKAGRLTRSQVNVLREQDPLFANACTEALDEAADLLEAEAWRRALEGVAQPLLHAGQPVFNPAGEAVIIRRYSDPLLVMLLRGCKPAKFQRRAGPAGAPFDPSASMREIAADYDPPQAEPTIQY